VPLTFLSALRKLNTEPSIGASHQISVHFGKAVSEKKTFRNRPIYNKNCLWQPCLLMDQNEMSNLYRGPSIDASYQVSYHLAKQFQRKSCFRNRPIRNKNCLGQPCLLMDQNGMSNSHKCFLPHFGPFGQAVSEEKIFRNRPIRNKNCLWWPCLLMDRDKMSKFYRGTPIDISYQVSVHLAKRFQRRRFFRNQPIRNKNGLWRPCLLMDGDEICNRNRGLSIDASYQVSVHLVKRFQRRRI
jgi:hypothetical protein